MGIKCAQEHPDDIAVTRFAEAMKEKMASSRAKGRSGWDDPTRCSVERLAKLLVEHVSKGDPVDIANFAMMLHQRGADHSVLLGINNELRVFQLEDAVRDLLATIDLHTDCMDGRIDREPLDLYIEKLEKLLADGWEPDPGHPANH